MNDNFYKVNGYMNENSLHDEIYINWGEDNSGDSYVVFEEWKEQERFIEIAKEVLELDKDTKDYEVERALDVSFVFSDEYTTCSDCDAIIRTSPDSYHWQPDYYIGDGFIVCNNCFVNNADYKTDYLQDKINNPKTAVNGLLGEQDLEDLGFIKLNKDSYENGLYEGQTDDPQSIFENIKDKYEEIVFLIDGVGQFDLHFSVWGSGEHKNEEE